MDNVIYVFRDDDPCPPHCWSFTAKLLGNGVGLRVGRATEKDAQALYSRWRAREARKLVGKRGPFNAA